jgi:peptide/nickel transport system ATP-binding protein
MPNLLEVKDLEVTFAMRRANLIAVNGVSFDVQPGERMGLVGESGAGKSVIGFSILNLIGKPGYISRGNILFEGRDLARLTLEEMRSIRGNRISMIFQDPMMTLNPVLTVGTQMVETLQAHQAISLKEAQEIAAEKLRLVQISSPAKRLSQYPHEFSGGMRQRIVIAIALITRPGLMIADEPTTALDVTIQAQILDLLYDLTDQEGSGLILITHDLAVVSQMTRKIAVLYAGHIVEMGPTIDVIQHPLHPYTNGLIHALPQTAGGQKRLTQIPGGMPSLYSTPKGCPFNPRCSDRIDICTEELPQLMPVQGSDRLVSCHVHGKG